MNTARRQLAEMRARLAEAEDALRAIRAGEVDAVVVAGPDGPQVFTLEGAEQAYRVLIESMNEGALTLTSDKVILYANRRFARMVKCPLEHIIGSTFARFLSFADRATLRKLLQRVPSPGATIQALLLADDGPAMPVQLSLRPLPLAGFSRAAFGLVVTDLTESHHSEERLRALSNRVVQAQEGERMRVALELHDRITQPLCAILVRSQALADRLSTRDGPLKREAVKLREMLGQTAEEVERISMGLRPSVLNELGFVPVLRDTGLAFAQRTGLTVKVACVRLTARLPAETELALYRILQQALDNVEQHAGARHLAISLRQRGAVIQLAIRDDGIGFDPGRLAGQRRGPGSLGLLSMSERASAAGGQLEIRSAPGHGTTIQAQIPFRRGPLPHSVL